MGLRHKGDNDEDQTKLKSGMVFGTGIADTFGHLPAAKSLQKYICYPYRCKLIYRDGGSDSFLEAVNTHCVQEKLYTLILRIMLSVFDQFCIPDNCQMIKCQTLMGIFDNDGYIATGVISSREKLFC